ncbi:MAG: OmpA family protein [Geminicoccaceae bacterium]
MRRLGYAGALFVVLTAVSSPTIAEGPQTVWTKEAIVQRLMLRDKEPLTRSILSKTRGLIIEGDAKVEEAASGWIDDLRITFEFNSSDITPHARSILDELGSALRDQRLDSYTFEIAGHTDGAGEPNYNLWLSERRAEAVIDYLSDNYGIEATRLVGKGYGEDELAFPNQPGNADNRRVEVLNLGG